MSSRNRTLLTSAAALSMAGLLVGGTFAAWSSSDSVNNNNASGGEFDLSVDGTGTDSANFNDVTLAPGEKRVRTFNVAAATTDPNLAGLLTVKAADIVGPDAILNETKLLIVTGATPLPGATCASANTGASTDAFTGGNAYEFTLKQLRDAAKTGSLGLLSTGALTTSSAVTYGSITVPSGTVAPLRPSTCVKAELYMPFSSATNTSQGQALTFDLDFDLLQVPTGGTGGSPNNADN